MSSNPSKQTSAQLSEAGKKGAAARQKRSNKWIKRREQLDLETLRSQIQTDELLDMLHKDATGVKRIEPGQRASAEILLNKALPNLQAVEQTAASAPLSEEEIMSSLAALAASDPAIKAQLQSILNGGPAPIQTEESAHKAA